MTEAQAVEQRIAGLVPLYQKMATLVSDQGETVERIDEYLTGASEYTDKAETELKKALETVRRNRGLILKIFAVLIFFIVVFMIFF